MSHRRIPIWVAMLSVGVAALHAQAAPAAPIMTTTTTPTITTTTVRGRVEVIDAADTGKTRHGKIPGTVVWLTPIIMTAAGGDAPAAAAETPPSSPTANLRLVQKNKSFEPHIL